MQCRHQYSHPSKKARNARMRKGVSLPVNSYITPPKGGPTEITGIHRWGLTYINYFLLSTTHTAFHLTETGSYQHPVTVFKYYQRCCGKHHYQIVTKIVSKCTLSCFRAHRAVFVTFTEAACMGYRWDILMAKKRHVVAKKSPVLCLTIAQWSGMIWRCEGWLKYIYSHHIFSLKYTPEVQFAIFQFFLFFS